MVLNHVSVMSLSLMLLFKKTCFLKPIYVLNCFQVIFDFLKCTEVIWKTGGNLGTAAVSSEHVPLYSHGLGVGVSFVFPFLSTEQK